MIRLDGLGSADAVCISGYGCTDPLTASQIKAGINTYMTNISTDFVLGGFDITRWWSGASTVTKAMVIGVPMVGLWMMSGHRRGRR